jgi:glutaminyl-peptide cyclotransferase
MKWIFLSCLLLCLSCRQREANPAVSTPYEASRFDGTNALHEVREFLSVGPRVAGTTGAQHAAEALVKRLTSLGVGAERQSFQDVTPTGSNSFINVIATIPGGKPGLILLGAHTDTKSGIESFDGANDSGSGVGVLLALAPILKAGAGQAPTIQLVFLDGEECRINYGPTDGLHGSRHLAAELHRTGRSREVLAVILLDMIGDRDLSVTVPRNGTPDLISRVFDAATESGVRSKFSLFPGTILDDHQPFLDHGMPAVDLIDFEYGSAPGLNDYWHTSADTVDKLSADSLEIVGRVVLRALNRLAYSTSDSFKAAN